MSLLPFLHRVAGKEDLNALDARLAMGAMLSGEGTPAQIAAFLTAMRMKGETVDEVVGFARGMRRVAQKVVAGLHGEPLLDTCGTGGDGSSTFNISTVAAFVIAGAGVNVAKHGNRSISSQCGSADLMEGLGVKITFDAELMGKAIREAGIGFLYAPAVHPAMKYVQAVRIDLKMRTVFNMLGPLTNPAGANFQIAGAFSEAAAEMISSALASLGLQRGLVVHGSDGLDEITTTGPTVVFEVQNGKSLRRVLEPAEFGVAVAKAGDLKGGDRDANVAIARAILNGEKGPRRDIVLVNAAAALVIAGKASDFAGGVKMAADSIDSGAARNRLGRLVEFTNS